MASPRRRSTTRSRAPRRALDWLREMHGDGSLPLLRLPARTNDLDEISQAAARLRAGATDVVILGTGGSSLGGQTLAQLADVGVRGARCVPRAAAHAFHGQSRSRHLRRTAREAAARDHALCRDLEIRRHRRDADADRGRAVGREAGRARSAHRRTVPRHQRAGEGRQGERPARSARRRRSRSSSTIPASAGAIRC